jgi:hypothetical protein
MNDHVLREIERRHDNCRAGMGAAIRSADDVPALIEEVRRLQKLLGTASEELRFANWPRDFVTRR